MIWVSSALRPILLVFVLLGSIYAWATPVFEASDELWHFGLVDHLARTWQLPVQQPDVETAWEQEGSQPPLYYLMAAALVAPIDRSDIDTLRQPNPHVKAGIPGASDNKNLVLHDTPHPPLEKTVLAVYVVRLFGIVLGLLTVTAVYASAQIVGGERAGLIAATITAFNPMFLFITASVNNDNLVIALNSQIIYLMLLTLRHGFSASRSLLMALLVALASLTKLSALALIPAIALAAAWVACRRRDWKGLVILSGMSVGAWALIGGWWYARNLTLYGELFGTQTMAAVVGAREVGFSLQTLLDEFEGFRVAYWGLFGAVNIQTFDWFYGLMDALVVMAWIGLAAHLRWLWENPHKVRGFSNWTNHELLVWLILLIAIVVTGASSVIAWTSQTFASQGRLLFPFVGAISTLLALGIARYSRGAGFEGTGIWITRIGLVMLGAFALTVPLASIAPQYATPVALVEAPPDSARLVYARFGEVALVGYDVADRRYQPGEAVPVTVYWQVLGRADRDYSLFLTFLDGSGQAIGKVDSYPGGGRLRTSTWQAGAVYADHYVIPLDQNATGRYPLRIQVGWWDYPTQSYIMPVDADGRPLKSVILDAGAFVDPNSQPRAGDLVQIKPVDFGGVVRLLAYARFQDSLVLLWESRATLPDDYTVFVHVLDSADNLVGQGDAPPVLPTHYWEPGEQYLTRHSLTYPQPLTSGTYRILVGCYRPGDFARLDAPYPDSAYPVATITIP